jgi:putative oxidoreductase
MSGQNNSSFLPRVKNVVLWVVQILLAAAFLMAGFSKLAGQPEMVANFDTIGLGQWFRYFTGAFEIVAAAFLVIPRLTPVGAAMLLCTMAGAVLAHLVVLDGSPVPAVVLGLLAALVLWGRFANLNAWLGGPPAPAMPVVKAGNATADSSHAW